jgi:hypothetical protein
LIAFELAGYDPVSHLPVKCLFSEASAVQRVRDTCHDLFPAVMVGGVLIALVIATPWVVYRRANHRVRLYDQLNLNLHQPSSMGTYAPTVARHYERFFNGQPIPAAIDWDALTRAGVRPSSKVEQVSYHRMFDPVLVTDSAGIVWYIDDNDILRVTTTESAPPMPRKARTFDTRLLAYASGAGSMTSAIEYLVDPSGKFCKVQMVNDRLVIDGPPPLHDKAAWFLAWEYRQLTRDDFMLHEPEGFFKREK